MKTAEEIYMSVQDAECPNINNLILPDEWQLKAMRAYAMQECDKVRQQCADNAELKQVIAYPNFPKVFVKNFKSKIDSVVGIQETLSVDKQSILSTPIELT